MGVRKKGSYIFIGSLVCLGLALVGYHFFRSTQNPVAKTHTPDCSNHRPANAALPASDDPILHKLSEYEKVCYGAVVDTMMFFTAMPTSNEEATTLAKSTADRLKAFAKYKIKPLVSFEPNTTLPTIITDVHTGKHDTILAAYFQSIKAEGITSEQLGTWILFPEANTPTWHNTDPLIFAANVTKVATIQRQVFPTSKLTILLNNTSYASDDEQWSHGAKEDLGSYVDTIPEGTLSSFGYQGFPFVAPEDAKAQYGQLDAKDFLPSDLAQKAADKLHTKNIWLNTGTFERAHTGTSTGEVTLSLTQRQQTLDSVTRQVRELQDQGYTVSVNLFAKNKSSDQEHIDWSYWPNEKYSSSPSTKLFVSFFDQLREHDVHLSLHDAM